MLSLVIPTFNEAENLPPLLEKLRSVIGAMPHEFLVVDDDSRDRTWETAETLARAHADIRVIRRVGRRGLSSAVVEGFEAAKGDILMVMDADGQHDASVVVRLYEAMQQGAVLGVASRYTQGGTTGDWSGSRLRLSKLATKLAGSLPAVRVTDPMSGFFAIRRDAFLAVRSRLKPRGFKILLEILSCLPRGTRTVEVPLIFGLRTYGESKMTLAVKMIFLAQLARIAARRIIQSRIQWWLCLAVALALLAAMLPRVWALSALYADPAARAHAQAALSFAADEHGLLLSEIEPLYVSRGAVIARLRRYHRGHDEVECVSLTDGSISLSFHCP